MTDVNFFKKEMLNDIEVFLAGYMNDLKGYKKFSFNRFKKKYSLILMGL